MADGPGGSRRATWRGLRGGIPRLPRRIRRKRILSYIFTRRLPVLLIAGLLLLAATATRLARSAYGLRPGGDERVARHAVGMTEAA